VRILKIYIYNFYFYYLFINLIIFPSTWTLIAQGNKVVITVVFSHTPVSRAHTPARGAQMSAQGVRTAALLQKLTHILV
jgi:hypothetical protein